jgi:tetratricopeptide (TPR) repeat protein
MKKEPEQVLREVFEQFPELEKARTLSVQKNYSHAAEAYSSLLESMAKKEPEDSVGMCLVYMEYARALLLANEEILVRRSDSEDADDLEIAWELLEICRHTFQREGMRRELIKTHSLLSEVSQESNNFQEAREDLESALELGIKEYGESDRRTAEIYFRLAMNYEMMNMGEQSIESTRKVVEVLERAKKGSSEKEAEEIDVLIKEMAERIEELRREKEAPN